MTEREKEREREREIERERESERGRGKLRHVHACECILYMRARACGSLLACDSLRPLRHSVVAGLSWIRNILNTATVLPWKGSPARPPGWTQNCIEDLVHGLHYTRYTVRRVRQS